MDDTDETPSSRSAGVDLGLLDELTTGLAEVQSALERIDAGSYGRCEQCGAAIDDAMLDSNPTARYCAAHLPFRPDGTESAESVYTTESVSADSSDGPLT